MRLIEWLTNSGESIVLLLFIILSNIMLKHPNFFHLLVIHGKKVKNRFDQPIAIFGGMWQIVLWGENNCGRKENKMKVIMLMAMTLDGKIGKNHDHFPDWTGKADKKLFVELSRRAGVVIMGSRTFDTIGRPLPGRKNIVLTRNLDRKSAWDNLIFTQAAPKDILVQLAAQGYSEAILAGGAMVNSLFAKAGLIHEIIVTISPKIFGHGLSLFAEDVDMELALQDVKQIDENVVCLTYGLSVHPEE